MRPVPANDETGRASELPPEDLSARFRLAWRNNGLFIAVEVKDEFVFQPLTGRKLYHGDHVVIWMDFTPGSDTKRTRFGKGQFQFGLSPGDFKGTPVASSRWVSSVNPVRPGWPFDRGK